MVVLCYNTNLVNINVIIQYNATTDDNINIIDNDTITGRVMIIELN